LKNNIVAIRHGGNFLKNSHELSSDFFSFLPEGGRRNQELFWEEIGIMFQHAEQADSFLL